MPGESPLPQHKRETEAQARNELTECGCLRKEGEWPTGQGPDRPKSLGEQGALTRATWFLGVTGGRQSRGEIVRAIFRAAQAQVTHRLCDGCSADAVLSTSQVPSTLPHRV